MVKRKPIKPPNAIDHDTKSSLKKSMQGIGLGVVGMGFAVVMMFVAYQARIYFEFSNQLKHSQLPRVVHEEMQNNPDLYWGSYRPNVFFGMKTRAVDSPLFGLMWIGDKSKQLRHSSVVRDSAITFQGWTEHDGVNFGTQEVVDKELKMKAEFLKTFSSNSLGKWAVNVSIASNKQHPQKLTAFFYVAIPDTVRQAPSIVQDGSKLGLVVKTAIGTVKVSFFGDGDAVHSHLRINHLAALDGEVMKNLVIAKNDNTGVSYIVLQQQKVQSPNVFLFQVVNPTNINLFSSVTVAEDDDMFIMKDSFSKELEAKRQNFETLFKQRFPLSPINDNDDLNALLHKTGAMKFALTNMLGTIGHFEGSVIIDGGNGPENRYLMESRQLFTGVPSRSFFPRGFLWDEGFHLLLITKWNPVIAANSLAHWLDTMNTYGWMAREQIRGSEALAAVPPEFVAQNPNAANPPTLFLAANALMQQARSPNTPLAVREFLLKTLRLAWPRLRLWYSWLRSTQAGKLPNTFRWRGREKEVAGNRQLNPKTLESGLDDFPRASHPSEDERHIDLHSWMAWTARTLAQLARMLDEDASQFEQHYEELTSPTTMALYWSAETKTFADFGLHTDSCKLRRSPPTKPSHQHQQQEQPPILRHCSGKAELSHVSSALGYVSIFPFILRLLQADDDRISNVLDVMTDKKHMWSDYGLRSVASSSPYFKARNTDVDPPYWRGNIWININYLALEALFSYAAMDGPYAGRCREVYTKLRANVLHTVIKQFELTGTLFEHYDEKTGKGGGTSPFTGWTALITLIASEQYAI